jgi:hypothetical protein
MMERMKHWPSTALGASVATAWVAFAGTLPAGCMDAVGNVAVWGPAVLVAILGAAIKGK